MIEKLILCLFLIRATMTDITERKIENCLIIGMLIGRIAIFFGNYWRSQKVILDVDTVSSQVVVMIVLVLFYYFRRADLGAGDIKLLLVGQLFLAGKELIPWFVLMAILTIITSVVGETKRLPLAPFVLFSTIIVSLMDYI